MPERIQLRRTKGWRMPADAVKVDRSTKWGNPFVVGRDGTRAECVQRLRVLLSGLLDMGARNPDELRRYHAMATQDHAQLRGKHLACWCPLTAPCHADVLLQLANQPAPAAELQPDQETPE